MNKYNNHNNRYNNKLHNKLNQIKLIQIPKLIHSKNKSIHY